MFEGVERFVSERPAKHSGHVQVNDESIEKIAITLSLNLKFKSSHQIVTT